MNTFFARCGVWGLAWLALTAMVGVGPLRAAPTFSVSGFVDETLYQGNGMITMRFDPSGRLWVIEKQGRILMFAPNPGGPTELQYDYYETGVLNALPNFASLTPVKSGVVNSFTLDPRQRDDDFAFRYTGEITISTAGTYTFYLSSDDGSRLFIDDALVVNYDGLHGAGEQSGTVTLSPGVHAIRVEYFERAGGQSLTVQYAGPGIPKGPVAQGAFKNPVVFADFVAQVNTQGERGLMGLALDPDFLNTRYLYVLYATGSDQRLVRLTANADFTAVVPGSETVLLSGLPNGNTVHKAGDIAFHPDDPHALFIMLGDDGERYLVGNLDNYYGKILRVSAADGKGLPGNPFYDGNPNSVRSRIWSHSYRNPYRFTFDPAAPVEDVLYISENGDGTDRLARIAKGADGAWPNSGYLVDSVDGKRNILQTSDPAKTGIAIVRSGPFAPGGVPVLYNARYGGGDRNEVRRWALTGAEFDTLTPLPEDGGAAFYSAFTDHGIVSFTPGPDGCLYYTDSGQGASTGTGWRLGRIRFVGGTAPEAQFTASALTGPSPLTVDFTDASSAPSSTIASRQWDFGDGAVSALQNPSHTFTEPGVYRVSLLVTNAQGLTDSFEQTVTVYHATTLMLSGTICDGRTTAGAPLAVASEIRLYQDDGTTPLGFPGGSGPSGNALSIPAGGVIQAAIPVQITGPGVVISAGESASDGVLPALVGVPLSTSVSSQPAEVAFFLSDTLVRGRVTDTLGAVARVDVGISRGTPGAFYAVAGGRDFLPASGAIPSRIRHRVVPDGLGYYHLPIRPGTGGTFYLDTSADTLAATHGRVREEIPVPDGADIVRNLVVGLFDGGQGEMDLSALPVTANVDFDGQIQPIFSTHCVACHTELATNSGGLDLDPGDAFAELFDRESVEAPGVKLVDPGAPQRSYLMEKINATHPQVGTSMRPGDPMAPADRALIRDWIAQLATSPRVEFTAPVVFAAEGTTAQIGVRRLGSVAGAFSVTVTSLGGSAAAGSDYTPVASSVSWAAGEGGEKLVSLALAADAVNEGVETVVLALSSPVGGSLGPQESVTVSIGESPYDSWREEQFGSEADDPSALPGEDYDGDGIPNLMEYALGMPPKDPQSAGLPVAVPGSTGRLELEFTPNPAATDLVYVVEGRDALESGVWEPLATRAVGGAWTTAPGVTLRLEDAVVVVDAKLIADTPRRFLRLRVERSVP